MTSPSPADLQTVRADMESLQEELQTALNELLTTFQSKLKPAERAEIEQEFTELNQLLERLKTGLVWVALFGKTSVGKSAVANALIGADVAHVGIEHDLTTVPEPYKQPPWIIVDVPGIMGEKVNEDVAVAEARKAHGHIFVLDGEPYQDELELFHLVHAETPNTPKIVFVNKYDRMVQGMPKKDQERVRERIAEKMADFVAPEDIVYGSALHYDPVSDTMIRQELPQLLDKMYADAGTFGSIVNIIDPAHRADSLTQSIRDKVFELRARIARKIIRITATSSLSTAIMPFGMIAGFGLLAGMVYAIFRVMGRKESKESTRNITQDLIKACAQELGVYFVAAGTAEVILDSADFLGPLGFFAAALADLAALSWFKYRRAIILGEVTIEYIRNGCSWGIEGQHAVIMRAKQHAEENFNLIKRKK